MYVLKSTTDFNSIEDARKFLRDINGLHNIEDFFKIAWEEQKDD